ncbi:hypothetical protein ACFZCY_42615 [Streptomyces sp. NPDC007983]|uniref:hypothetical protein n=1 Tax=Streptomyces sp. NPDC007983 TaxID=3364800 RepID=UPI0036E07401
MSSHARKNQARQYRDQHKVAYTAGLQQIRDCLPPAQGATKAAPGPSWTADTVPQELLTAVEQHCRWTSNHLHRAVQAGREYGESLREWQRLVSYALTDAHAHNQLLIGTITAFLQQQGVEDGKFWPEGIGGCGNATLAPPNGEPFGLVSGQGQAAMDEEVCPAGNTHTERNVSGAG